MLSNQTILESKFQELDTRVTGLQVSERLPVVELLEEMTDFSRTWRIFPLSWQRPWASRTIVCGNGWNLMYKRS